MFARSVTIRLLFPPACVLAHTRFCLFSAPEEWARSTGRKTYASIRTRNDSPVWQLGQFSY